VTRIFPDTPESLYFLALFINHALHILAMSSFFPPARFKPTLTLSRASRIPFSCAFLIWAELGITFWIGMLFFLARAALSTWLSSPRRLDVHVGAGSVLGGGHLSKETDASDLRSSIVVGVQPNAWHPISSQVVGCKSVPETIESQYEWSSLFLASPSEYMRQNHVVMSSSTRP
jgi:hypothetical protein